MRRRLGFVALGLVVAWAAAAGVLAVAAYRDLHAGERHAEAVRDELAPSALLAGKPVKRLDRAEARFGAARRRLDAWPLKPVRWLPVIGRQLRSATALARAAEQVAAIGSSSVRAASTAVAKPADSGSSRVALVRSLRSVASRARARLEQIDLGPEDALLAVLADRRSRFATDLAAARRGASRADDALGAALALLSGPRDYLVLAAHNGEMRAGSGMFLSVGVLTVDRGELRLSDMTPAGELTLAADSAPPLTDDIAELWGWMNPNREWRNLGASPRFPVNAKLAAAMWEARTGERVDGVLALDLVALQAIAGAAGEIDADGVTLDAEEIVPYLLVGQYREFEGAVDERRDRLAVIAAAAVDVFERADWEAPDLASRLADAAAGRHLLAWSRHAAEQRGWRAAGIAGDVPADSLLVAVLNRGGNKLDQFLRVDADLTLEQQAEITITLENRTPAGLPRYVAGPYPGSGVEGYGDYVGILTVTLPGTARSARFEPAREIAAAGPDGSTRVIATEVIVRRGEAQTLRLRFELPADRGNRGVRVLPSARLPAVRWEAGDRRWWDRRAVTLGPEREGERARPSNRAVG